MEEIAPFPDDVDDDIMLKMSSATFTWEAEEEEKIGMCFVKVGIVMLSVMCLLVIYSIIVSFELCVRLMWELFTCTVCVCVLFLLCVCALRVCVCVCACVCICVCLCVLCVCGCVGVLRLCVWRGDGDCECLLRVYVIALDAVILFNS